MSERRKDPNWQWLRAALSSIHDIVDSDEEEVLSLGVMTTDKNGILLMYGINVYHPSVFKRIMTDEQTFARAVQDTTVSLDVES